MAIDFTCKCGNQITLDDDWAGKNVPCLLCGEMLQVPAAGADEVLVLEDFVPDEDEVLLLEAADDDIPEVAVEEAAAAPWSRPTRNPPRQRSRKWKKSRRETTTAR